MSGTDRSSSLLLFGAVPYFRVSGCTSGKHPHSQSKCEQSSDVTTWAVSPGREVSPVRTRASRGNGTMSLSCTALPILFMERRGLWRVFTGLFMEREETAPGDTYIMMYLGDESFEDCCYQVKGYWYSCLGGFWACRLGTRRLFTQHCFHSYGASLDYCSGKLQLTPQIISWCCHYCLSAALRLLRASNRVVWGGRDKTKHV